MNDSPTTDAVVTALTDATLVVMPTNVAAHYWRRKVLHHNVPVVWGDSIISWGQFRNTYCTVHEKNEVDSLLRMVLGMALLERNAAHPFLSTIVPHSQRAHINNYVDRLMYLIPMLPEIISASQVKNAIDHDIQALYAGYQELLNTYGLNEPLWSHTTPDQKIMIFFPQIIPDWHLHQHYLNTPAIAIYSIPSQKNIKYIQYHSIYEEIKTTAQHIVTLIQQGVEPTDIVISAVQLENYWQVLASIMQRFGIPHSFHVPNRAIHSAPYQLLETIAQLVQFDFYYEGVYRLFTNPTIPWKEDVPIKKILHDAVRYQKVYRSIPKEMRDVFSQLYNCRSARKLQYHFNDLFSDYINVKKWGAFQARALSHCRAIIASLVLYEEHLDIHIRQPFTLLIQSLQNITWHPRHTAGVQVYTYPHGAGLYPKHHFVINLTHQALQEQTTDPHYLPEYAKEFLNLSQDHTANTIRVLSHSGAQVQFSYSTRAFSGPATPLPFFYQLDSAHTPRHNEAPVSVPLPPAHSSAGPSPRTPHPIPMPHLFDTEEPHKVILTFERLRQLLTCPLHFYIRYGIQLHPEPDTIDIDSALHQGILAHTILRDTLREWQHTHHTLDKEREEELQHILQQKINGTLSKDLHIPLLNPAYSQQFCAQLPPLLHTLLNYYHGWSIAGTEERRTRSTDAYIAHGTIDLLLNHPTQGWAIVDFKRSRAKLLLYNEHPFLQLAFYSLLIDGEAINGNTHVTSAAYLFTQDADKPISMDSTPREYTKENPSNAKVTLLKLIADYISHATKGDIALGNRELACDQCSHPSICRASYQYRAEHSGPIPSRPSNDITD